MTGAGGRVGHFVRAFLARTETFIWNQLRTLERYEPTAFCHHRAHEFAGTFDVVAVAERLPPALRPLDAVSYRALRHLPRPSATLLAREVQARSMDLLHFHYLVDARFFLAVKRATRLPAVVSGYGYDVSMFPRTMRGLGARYLQPLFREVECFLAMSEDMERDLVALGCPPEKVVVHYYGTDTGRFEHPGRRYEDEPVVNVLVCGTLEVKKAQDRVLRALRLWEDRSGRRGAFRVTLAGDGPLRGELEQIVRDFGWESRVAFLGHVPHQDERLVQAYRDADLFALPSITVGGDKEGIPGTIVEAMAAGLPVVATYHAGIPAAVTDDVTGLLVEEQDLDGLAAALGGLVSDRALRERLGRAAARDAAERLRLQTKTPDLEAVYDRLVARRGRSG